MPRSVYKSVAVIRIADSDTEPGSSRMLGETHAVVCALLSWWIVIYGLKSRDVSLQVLFPEEFCGPN